MLPGKGPETRRQRPAVRVWSGARAVQCQTDRQPQLAVAFFHRADAGGAQREASQIVGWNGRLLCSMCVAQFRDQGLGIRPCLWMLTRVCVHKTCQTLPLGFCLCMLCLCLMLFLRRRSLMRRHQEALAMHDEVPKAVYIHVTCMYTDVERVLCPDPNPATQNPQPESGDGQQQMRHASLHVY